jgi:hypothetical protein
MSTRKAGRSSARRANERPIVQSTVSDTVAECDNAPEVAVTVTVDVVELPVLLEPLPQPLNQPMPIPQITSRSRLWSLRHRPKPRKHSATASVAPPGRKGLVVRCRLALAEEVAIVSVVAALAPDGVIVDGEKLQVAPEGKPAHVNDTADENPFCGVTVIAVVPFCPAVTVSEAGEAAMPKSAGGKMMV